MTTNNKPSEPVSDALRNLDGVAVANIDEPSSGDLERVLNENRKLRTTINIIERDFHERGDIINKLTQALKTARDTLKLNPSILDKKLIGIITDALETGG